MYFSPNLRLRRRRELIILRSSHRMQFTSGAIVKLVVFTIVANMGAVVALPEPNSLASRQGGVINCLSVPCNTTDGCCGDDICTVVGLPDSTSDGVSFRNLSKLQRGTAPTLKTDALHVPYMSGLLIPRGAVFFIGLHLSPLRRHMLGDCPMLPRHAQHQVHLPASLGRDCWGECLSPAFPGSCVLAYVPIANVLLTHSGLISWQVCVPQTIY